MIGQWKCFKKCYRLICEKKDIRWNSTFSNVVRKSRVKFVLIEKPNGWDHFEWLKTKTICALCVHVFMMTEIHSWCTYGHMHYGFDKLMAEGTRVKFRIHSAPTLVHMPILISIVLILLLRKFYICTTRLTYQISSYICICLSHNV